MAESPEEKLRELLDGMKAALAQEGAPQFKVFWEARAQVIPLFKEGVHPAIRSQLWSELSELTEEARRLRSHLDAEAKFAAEQLEKAIEALEQEVAAGHKEFKLKLPVILPLKKQLLAYETLQRELAFLNKVAARTNGLRKELVATQMRLKEKNALFKRLSTTGESIFPRRKELIKEISGLFSEDVDRFINEHFVGGKPKGQLFKLREMIKGIQSFAKAITIGPHAFTKTRERLSGCWDLVRSSEKEHKKEMAAKQEIFKEHMADLTERLDAAKSAFEAGDMLADEFSKRLSAIWAHAGNKELGNKEKATFKAQIGEARQLIVRKDEEQTRELEGDIASLMEEAQGLDVEALKQRRDALLERLNNHPRLQERMAPLAEILEEAEERSLDNLQEVLKRRQVRKERIKERLEELRRASGQSGFDMGQALLNDQMLKAEKERLARVEKLISETEKQIQE